MGFTDYESYDAVGLADLIRRGEVTPEEVLDSALERMAERDPKLGAVVISMEEQARKLLANTTFMSNSLAILKMFSVPSMLTFLYSASFLYDSGTTVRAA